MTTKGLILEDRAPQPLLFPCSFSRWLNMGFIFNLQFSQSRLLSWTCRGASSSWRIGYRWSEQSCRPLHLWRSRWLLFRRQGRPSLSSAQSRCRRLLRSARTQLHIRRPNRRPELPKQEDISARSRKFSVNWMRRAKSFNRNADES